MIQYNHVIECYNADENRIFDFYMEKMSTSASYTMLWRIYSHPCALLLFVMAIAIPVLGSVLYLWLLGGTIFYFVGFITVSKNKEVVKEPFQNMVFCPDLCRTNNVVNKFYEIKGKDLQGFSFHEEVMKQLKGKEFRGEIRFMIYDSKLWGYFYNYPKHKLKHIMVFLLGTGMLVLQIHVLTILNNHYSFF